MAELARTLRRATLALVVLASGQLLLDGIDPYGIFSAPSRGLQIALAIVLLAGIIPGSYLTPVLRRIGERASSVSPRRVMLVAIGAPLGIIAFEAYFIVGELTFLGRFDDESSRITLWVSLAIALIQLAILTLNLLDLARSSSRRSRA